MSQSDDIKESTQLLAETIQICECNSSMTSDPLTTEVSTTADALKRYTNVSDSLDGMGSVENIASTTSAVDPYNQYVIVELSHPSFTEADTDLVSQDLPKPICTRSDSESRHSENSFHNQYSGPWWDYVFLLRKFKGKGYLIPFEIICLAFTIASCFLGAYYWEMCPANVYIPQYIFFNGAVATFSLCIQIAHSVWICVILPIHNYVEVTETRFIMAFGIGWIALITTLFEMSEFYTMPYSFHSNEENYCNETFYWCVHNKNIAAAILVSLTAMIYIPSFNEFIDIWDILDTSD